MMRSSSPWNRSTWRSGGTHSGCFPAASRALLCGLLILETAALQSQVIPLGDDFQVDTSTLGYHRLPQVASAADGGFVVAWSELSPSYQHVVSGRRFDSSGEPIGSELEIGPGESRGVSGIGADLEGDFVVVWGLAYSGPGGGDPDDVHARRFLADGTPAGEAFVVNTDPGFEYLGHARVAVHSSGSFVVTWENYGAFGQRFDPDGEPLGDNFELPGGLEQPEIASRPAGGFVVAGQSFSPTPLSPEGCVREVTAHRYSVQGSPIGGPIPVHAEATCSRHHLDVAASASGSFVVAWTGSDAPYGGGIFIRRFATTGTPLGSTFRVDDPAAGYDHSPQVQHQPGGDFVVVWTSTHSTGSDDSGSSVQARRFAADGTALGGAFQVNSITPGNQMQPAVTFDADGRLIVAWESSAPRGLGGSELSVQVRRFLLPFFTDGFENGTTSRWSVAQGANRPVPD